MGFVVLNLCGCLFIVAGMRDSAKAKQSFNVSYSKAIDVVKEVFTAGNLKFTKAIIKSDIAVVKGTFANGKTMYIEIFRISDNESRIEVRVGTSESGKPDAQKILDDISQRLK